MSKKRLLRAAGKAPSWIRRIAATKPKAAAWRNYRTRKLGKLGPASEVRHIDPQAWLDAQKGKGT
jgi:hypothetical protein